MKKILLLLSAACAILTFARPVFAESGCCQVLDDTLGNPTPWHFETLDRAACATVNDPDRPDRGWTLSRDRASYYTFDPGKAASYDFKDCDGRKGPAADTSNPPQKKPSDIKSPVLSVSIPGFGNFSKVECGGENDTQCEIPWIGEYINAIYKYSLLVISLLSAIMLMIGGLIYITAAGNREQVSRATGFIKGSVLGLTLAFCSYLLLFIVNPDLSVFSPLGINYTKKEDLKETISAIGNHGLSPEPNKGSTYINSNSWVQVPNDPNGLGIWARAGDSATSSAASVEALKKAAACMKQKDPNYIIRVESASRTQQRQQELYNQNCRNGICNPLTCNPAGNGCPHTSGQAFDAWGCYKKDANSNGTCKYTKAQSDLQDCMLQNGFCILSKECWHFEIPQFSSACGSAKNYAGTYCASIRPK